MDQSQKTRQIGDQLYLSGLRPFQVAQKLNEMGCHDKDLWGSHNIIHLRPSAQMPLKNPNERRYEVDKHGIPMTPYVQSLMKKIRRMNKVKKP